MREAQPVKLDKRAAAEGGGEEGRPNGDDKGETRGGRELRIKDAA